LEKWQINEDNKCKACGKIKTIDHFLVQCPPTLEFWQTVYNWWKANTNIDFPIIAYENIFGIPNEKDD
jgi:hypothetical protein